MKELKVRLTFQEKVLGTSPSDKEIYDSYIASNAPTKEKSEEETKIIGEFFDEEEAVEKKTMTVFPRTEDDKPFLYDYQVRGFFKHACSMLKNVPKTESSKIKAYKKYIDGLVFVKERQIPFTFEGEIGTLQRPLRASTPQGERIALACSESIPAGATVEFTVQVLKDDLIPAIKEWLDYGILNGLCQWHNGGYGKFSWEEI